MKSDDISTLEDVMSIMPKLSEFLIKYRNSLKDNPYKGKIPTAAGRVCCSASFTLRGISEVWSGLISDKLLDGPRSILMKVPSLIYSLIENCHCILHGYEKNVLINPDVLLQVSDIIAFAEKNHIPFSMTNISTFDPLSLESDDEFAIYDIMHAYVRYYRHLITVVEELALYLHGIQSDAYLACRRVSEQLFLGENMELAFEPKVVLKNVTLDQYWIGEVR